MTSRRPSILNRSSTQTELPTQEDQIRGYRQMARNRHQVARTTRRVFGRSNYNRTLETAVDPERQLEISRERRANLVPAEVLYSNNRSTARHRVYEHYSEQRILCVGENQINLRLCNEESYENLRNSGLQHIHLGIFMIRLHALHRRSAGTNALVVLRDTRWEDSRQIIATMEVDLSAGTQLVYTFPDMILSVNDFHNHIEVAIQTHGYDTWQGGESNLLITMALTGRLSNTSYMGFQYSVENVVDHLTTTGITAIPGERRSIEELEGMSWHLKPPEQTSVRVPSRVAVNERLNRSVSLRFERYRQTPQPPRYSVDQHETRSNREPHNVTKNEEHFIGICLQAPQEEHISYDICSCESCLNEARILEEEPLNKVRRSNKPKRSRQRSSEKWSTLGEPSGKWDYYVRYDAPPDITPIEEVAATGWGDEFSDDEVTPGKVTILEERSDWDDDERSGGQILVIQERLAQNQQEFLDEYLPQWDEQLAIQKKESGWESITINRLNNQTWSDNKAKLAFVENLLGESEKLMWQQWRTAYPNAYAALEAIADEPQNITSQVRQLILLEDPYRGSTDEQDRAYRDLDRITCEDTKNLWSFLEDFRQLATKSGRLYFPSTTEKLFAKLPPSLSKKIEESFRAKHPGLSSGVLPAIKFTHTFVSEMCKDAALAKELRDLSLCSAIPIPGYYKNNRKKYGMRKSRTYKGKPHNSHEGHFAKDCRRKNGNIARSAVYQELDLDDNWDIVSADFDDSSVYNTPVEETVFMAIENDESDDDLEEEDSPPSHYAFMYHPGPPTKIAEMVQNKELPAKSKECEHEWNENTPQKQEEEKDFNSNEVKLLKELLKEKTEQVQQMIRDQAKEYYENKAAMQKKEELWQSKESLLVRDLTDALKIIDQLGIEKKRLEELGIEKKRLEEQKDEEIRKLKAQLQKKEEEAEVQFPKEEFPPLGNTHVARPCVEAEFYYSGNATTGPKVKKVTNQLYNVKVEFDIPNCTAFGTTAI
ncbi:hypothetical protein Tco_1313218 [Tanacetum coccineum]